MVVRNKFRDTLLLDASRKSEQLISLARILIFFVIGLIPTTLYFIYQDPRPEVFLSVILSGAALIIAIAIYLVLRRDFKFRSLPWIITATDVSLVTLVLLLLSVYSHPLIATNSLVVWQVYGVLILSTTLRLNYRITLFAGFLCILEYGVLVSYLDMRWELSNSGIFSREYGSFSWQIQLGRFFVLLLTTLIAVAFVIRNHRLVVYSGTDSLTGLKNRAYFEHIFSNQVQQALDKKEPLSLAFIDMDHFKSINDNYGHATGDLALQQVADVLKSFANKPYKVARWGGEEFVFLFPNTAKAESVILINEIRDKLKQGIEIGTDKPLVLCLSAGVSQCPNECEDPVGLINLADDRMLQAKKEGRDKVVS